MKHFDTNMFAIKSNFEHNHLRTLILSTLIVFFTLLCSFLLMLMIINIYHHYQYTNDLSYNHDRHQQWYHHNQDEIKTNSIDGDPIDQQSTETSTPLSLITTLSSISSSSSSSPSSDLITDKHQGLMNNQGVESYVQSVLDSTFKATQEYLNQRKQNPIN